LNILKLTTGAILFLCLALAMPSFAQRKSVQNLPTYDNMWLQLGFSLGYNNMFYRPTLTNYLLNDSNCDTVYGVETRTTPGFNLGIITGLRLNKFMNIRLLPGMNFGQRNIEYKIIDPESKPDSPRFITYPMYIPSIYIESPLLLKICGLRINNYRPFLIGGVNVRYDLESNRKNRKKPKDNLFDDYTIKTYALDYFYEAGAGIDFYMTYFKFGIELKMSYGVKDILRKESVEYSTVFDKLKSKLFILSLNLE
jgi:hypothetical protein